MPIFGKYLLSMFLSDQYNYLMILHSFYHFSPWWGEHVPAHSLRTLPFDRPGYLGDRMPGTSP